MPVGVLYVSSYSDNKFSSTSKGSPSGLGIESMAKDSQPSYQPQVQGAATTASIVGQNSENTYLSGSSGNNTTLIGNTTSVGMNPAGSDDLPERKIFPGVVHEQSRRGST